MFGISDISKVCYYPAAGTDIQAILRFSHLTDANPSAIDSFTVLGCCMSVEHFAGIARLNTEGQTGRRRSIIVEVENKVSHTLVHLSWDSNA